ncbi:predicted protein [Plenodomus lingam JN3]|uniref:Predicted protein n=1 Tax=Leptosphaeria maculans (strain JN3 / isolate v23.1.3 / race Av1-4-5-6-7-8) TaxID=985895 RepID=E4ZY76_LEPMJ|nr:predicted protein [Plenodomus lingam JN3]CBX96321.1 predicted protein [Plenodomus lingam JN3]
MESIVATDETDLKAAQLYARLKPHDCYFELMGAYRAAVSAPCCQPPAPKVFISTLQSLSICVSMLGGRSRGLIVTSISYVASVEVLLSHPILP